MSREGVRHPRLLRGENGCLREAARLRPTALSVEMNLYPLCRAHMTLAADDAPVRMHDFVEIYGQNGLLGIFRVTEIAESCGETREISLNHALDVFADAVLPGEETVQAPVAQVLARIAAAQTAVLGGEACWQIGTVEDTAEYAFENRYDNALQCLCDLARRETDYYFSFDFSAFPWRLHFLRRNNEVLSEFRMSRNIGSCRVTADDGALCTRLYLSVETGEDGETVTETYEDAAARAQWGIICKTAGVRAADVPDRAAWAQRYFARYGRPDVQITVDGEELNRLTGERMDEMHLGRLCRVALAESGAVYNERIVSIRYPDLLRQPERVTVCLAGKEPDAASGWAALQRRQRTADARMDRAEKSMRVMRTETRTRLTAQDQHITDIGTILHAAGLEIDPHGVWLYASEDGPSYALGASFKVQADNITAEVTRATAQEGVLSSRISQTADAIRLKVSKGDVATQLSVECGNVTISGGDLVVSGYITSQGLVTAMASFSGQISAPSVVADAFYLGRSESSRLVQKEVKMGTLAFTNSFTFGTGTAGTMDLGHYHDISASESNGVITITQGAAQSTAGTATFNIADTQFYQDAVASAEATGRASIHLSSSWNANNDRLTVEKTTSGNTNAMSFTVGVKTPTITYSTTTHKYTATAQATVDSTVRGSAASATSGTEAYDAGYNAGENYGYSQGWNAANAQYTQASYARKNLNRYGHAELYVKERETYYKAGNHYWYWSGSDGWDTLYTKSSS